MKYEELPEKIQEKALRFVKKNGEFSRHISFIYKNDTAFGWYDLGNEASINLLIEKYQEECHLPMTKVTGLQSF